jgi:hypothetical protein
MRVVCGFRSYLQGFGGPLKAGEEVIAASSASIALPSVGDHDRVQDCLS